jgi:hypothetical protein
MHPNISLLKYFEANMYLFKVRGHPEGFFSIGISNYGLLDAVSKCRSIKPKE